MADLQKYKQEILNSLVHKDEETLSLVQKELDEMASTEGLEEKNNLETFWYVWKDHQGEVGDRNEVNSWTAWALGMTTQKPKSDDFLPARRAFARVGFPDIDSDFDYFRRDEIYEYLVEKYGRDYVGNIGTYQTLSYKKCHYSCR